MEKQPAENKLSQKDLAFCEHYLTHYNATEAYIAAGFKCKNRHVAEAAGHKLLRFAEIQKYLRERTELIRKELERETGITKARVVLENVRIAFASIANYIDQAESEKQKKLVYKPMWKLTEDEAAAIARVITDKDGNVVDFRLHNKDSARETLSKHFGILKELGTADNPLYIHGLDALVNLPLPQLLFMRDELKKRIESTVN